MSTKFRIRISRDENASCPFEDWDCEPDLMYESGRYRDRKDYSNGNIVEFIKQFPSNNQIIKHQKQLCEILDIDHEYLCERELTKDEKADEIRWEISKDCRIDQLAQLCELFKISHHNYTSTGYSQGDWANVLIVLTDEFYERTGCDRRNAKSILDGTEKLFDAWAWGDVYHYEVEKATEMVKLTREDFNNGKFEECEDELEWSTYESCSGFYGEDIQSIVEHSGAPLEVVKDAFYYENIDKWVEYEQD
jgi:hypothetical protein